MQAAGAFALYAAVTALLFRELLPVMATHLFSDLGDTLLNTTIFAWNARHVPLTGAWWNFPGFAPLAGVTAFTEHLLLFYPLTSPVVWLTGNPVLAHNLALLACLPLNGLAAFLLTRHLTGSGPAGVIGGLAFAFAPYHTVQLSHVQTVAAFGMPLALLGLHRYVGPAEAGHYVRRDDTGGDVHTGVVSGFSRTGALLLFGCGWLLTALSNAYMLVFFPLLVVGWCAWFIRPREWRRVVAPLVTAVLFTLPLVPLLLGYRARQAAYGFARGAAEMQQFSADVIGLLGISHREVLWRGFLPHTFEEGALFPGLAITVLALGALVARTASGRSEATPTRRAGRLARWLLGAGGLLTLVVAARLWTGPFGWRLGPLPLPPFAPYWAFTIALGLTLAGAVLTGRFRRAWARRDVVMFYAAAVVALWLLALGPQPEWSASRLRALTYGPYYALAQVPGFNSVRVPARAWLPAVLCLSVLAACGAARLRRGHVLVAAALVIVAEGAFEGPILAAPPPMPPGVIPANALVLDLPVNEGFWNATPQYRAVRGGYWSINGYSGYEPPHFNPLRHEIADLFVDALNPYRMFGDLYVIVRREELPHLGKWVLDHPGAAVTYEDAQMRVVRLPPMTDPPFRPLPLPLPRPDARPFGVR